MPAVLRNGRAIQSQEDPPPGPSKDQPPSSAMASSRKRPTSYLLLAYPIVLTLGAVYSVLSPAAVSPPAAPLAAGVTSDFNTPSSLLPAPNYFATKRNLFNVYFVKIGWFWTTVAFVLLQISTRPSPRITQTHYFQATLRYTLVTLSWVLTTQWCFGPALIDRSFALTGGHCEPHIMNTNGLTEAVQIATIASGPACKAAGGHWRGGHDISGHVFMLILSSAFLLYELYIADGHSSHPSVSPQAAAAVAHDMTEEERKAVGGWESETQAKIRIYSRYLLYGVVGLDFWMLLMTAIWFHTWLEKLSGLMIAGMTVWGVYFLGDFAPQWRQIIGGL